MNYRQSLIASFITHKKFFIDYKNVIHTMHRDNKRMFNFIILHTYDDCVVAKMILRLKSLSEISKHKYQGIYNKALTNNISRKRYIQLWPWLSLKIKD